jgi:hypothetical protein
MSGFNGLKDKTYGVMISEHLQIGKLCKEYFMLETEGSTQTLPTL